MVPLTMAIRPCSECTACCTLMAVTELGKPFYQKCVHVSSAGCGIYETKPHGCNVFHCLWTHIPIFPEAYRPDKYGVMFEAAGSELSIYEIEKDRLLNQSVWNFIHKVYLHVMTIMETNDNPLSKINLHSINAPVRVEFEVKEPYFRRNIEPSKRVHNFEIYTDSAEWEEKIRSIVKSNYAMWLEKEKQEQAEELEREEARMKKIDADKKKNYLWSDLTPKEKAMIRKKKK